MIRIFLEDNIALQFGEEFDPDQKRGFILQKSDTISLLPLQGAHHILYLETHWESACARSQTSRPLECVEYSMRTGRESGKNFRRLVRKMLHYSQGCAVL